MISTTGWPNWGSNYPSMNGSSGPGRPRALARVVLQAAPKALCGLAWIAFVLFWMTGVIHGGHNNWDRGRPVPPFATHNVLIATFAGLWMIPPGLYFLTTPLQIWRRLKKTSYALTTDRALVIEHGLNGQTQFRSYAPGALRLMRLEEHGDGSGDLIFGTARTRLGFKEQAGFLGIDHAGDVQALIQNTLLAPTAAPVGARGASAESAFGSAPGAKSHRLSLPYQFVLFALKALSVVLALGIIATIAGCLAALFLGPQVMGFDKAALERLDILDVAAGVAMFALPLLAGALVSFGIFQLAIRIPVEITISDDGNVLFHSRLRTVAIPAREIVSIQTGEWFDPNDSQVVVRHKGGKLTLFNQYSDFLDLLADVRALNPSVEIKGF